MEVPNVLGSVLTSCQWAARLSWSRWEGSCLSHPCTTAGSQFTLDLIHLGPLICPAAEFIAHWIDAQVSFSPRGDIDTNFCPSQCPHFFAFFVWAVWMHSLSLDVFSWKLLVIANWSLGFCLYCSYVCWSLWSVPNNYPAHSELQGELDHNWKCSLRVACTDLFDWDQNPVVFNFFLYFYPGFTDSSCCLICLSEASA